MIVMKWITSITRDIDKARIFMSLSLGGSGRGDINTGIGFFNHILSSFARHGFFDLDLMAKGDLKVDIHHTIEDTGIVLGQVTRKTIGDKKETVHYGPQILSTDESLIFYTLGLCGRPYPVWDLILDREKVGDLEAEVIREFFHAVSYRTGVDLYLKQLSGTSNHHIIEATFKTFTKTLDSIMATGPRLSGVLSTEGNL